MRSRRQPHRVRRLLKYAGPYRRGWAGIAVVTLLASIFSVAQPWPMMILVDHVLNRVPLSGSWAWALGRLPGTGSAAGLVAWAVLGGLLMFAISAVADVLSTRLWIRVGQGMVYDLAADLFARVQRRSLLFHTRNSVGDLMARVTGDSWCVYKLVDTVVVTPLHAILMIVGITVLMLQLNATLTLVTLATAPLMTAATMIMGRRLREAGVAQREIESAIHVHVQQTLAGLAVVQAFAQEEREHAKFQGFASVAIRAVRRSALVGAFAGLGPGLVNTLGSATILWVGSRQVLTGTLTIGGLLVFLTYLGMLQAQFGVWTTVYTGLQSARANIDRVSELLEGDPEVADKPGALVLERARGHVEFQDVTFGYEPGRPVLDGVSLDVPPEQTVAIVGSTGAGKTTLVGMVLRFADPWSGRVMLDGRDLRGIAVDSLRRQVALVLQEPFLTSASVAENIAFGDPAAPRAAIEAAARAANADGFIRKLEGGYDAVIGERGTTLSGGERQRLAIARALLCDAPVLILDEPTSAIDAGTEQQILEALKRLVRGRTTIIIAHRLSTIRNADKIVVLERGRIVETGTHSELLDRGGAYARLHASQFGMVTAEEDAGMTAVVQEVI